MRDDRSYYEPAPPITFKRIIYAMVMVPLVFTLMIFAFAAYKFFEFIFGEEESRE